MNKSKLMMCAEKANLNQEECTTKAGEFCYLAFFVILCALKALGFYEGQAVFNFFMVIACLFLLAKIALTRHTKAEYIVIVLFLGMGLLTYACSGEKSLLINLMVIVGIKGISERKVVQSGLTSWGIGYVCLTVLSLLGLHSDAIFLHTKQIVGTVGCHSLGYAHSNILHINYLCISAMVLYLAKDRFSRKQKCALLAILFAVDIWVFLYSMSFTGMLGTLILYFFYFYVTMRGHLGKLEKILAELILPFCLVFSLVGPLVIKGELFDRINAALNTRYYLTQWFLTEQPIRLFGSCITVPVSNYYLDCSYAYLLVYLGIVPFIVLILLYLGLIHHLVRENRNEELAIVLSLCIAGVTETFLFNLAFKNITLVFVGTYLYTLLGRVQAKKASSIADMMKLCRGKLDQDGFLVISRVSKAVCHEGRKILSAWMKHALYYLALFVLVLAAAGGIVLLTTRKPDAVYYNGSVFNRTSDEPIYLTQEEVDELRSDGNFVIEYPGEDEPMYRYEGSTANWEYLRIVVSVGAYSAIAVCCVTAMVKDRKKEPE